MRLYAVNSDRLPQELVPVLAKCAARYTRTHLRLQWRIGDTTLDRLLSGGRASKPVIARMTIALSELNDTEDPMTTKHEPTKPGHGHEATKHEQGHAPQTKTPGAPVDPAKNPASPELTKPHAPGAQPGVQQGHHSQQQQDAQQAGSNPQKMGNK